EFRRFVAADALLSLARERADAFHGSEQARRRNPGCCAALLPECAHAAGTRTQSSGRESGQAAGGSAVAVRDSKGRLATKARRPRRDERCPVARIRKADHFWLDQEALWATFTSADLRIGAVSARNTTILYDVGNPSVASLWTHGNHGNLHDGRPT